MDAPELNCRASGVLLMPPHGQGPPRSTSADAIALIVAHYAAITSEGAWASATAYAVGDTVERSGAVYLCFAAGTSAGVAPSGMGSQRDANGVGWTPFIYVGERYLRQHGAPPRIVIVQGDGEIGAPRQLGAGNIAKDVEEIRAFLWAAEDLNDIARYAAIEAMKDAWINVIRKIMPARAEIRSVNPAMATNVVTFGEDRQIIVRYERQVPRDAAIWNVLLTPVAPPDPDRPAGDTGYTFEVVTPVEGSR